ncbi:MAG TPA: NapC/NirT family cytochrome c [Candidatus Sulfotelmatobacter sp.]|jgi:cytochrome c-type protein NapC|nr:NapC/NirT family cytochrome c [Candidatus Sulfotelmatobacter sp.]
MTLPNKKPFIGILVVCGLFIGAGLTFGAASALHMTNTLGFCTSCHEMADNNFEEYKNTIHARNRTGVKAICSDCHVPHEFPDILIRKVTAVSDIYNHALGTVDTKEKFNAHRLEMAKNVWRRMKETDSRECRNCHDVTAMQTDMQGKVAQKNHQKLFEGTATCIDCHYGIAHKEPPGGLEPQDVMEEMKQTANQDRTQQATR